MIFVRMDTIGYDGIFSHAIAGVEVYSSGSVLIHPNEVQEFPMMTILFLVSGLFFAYSVSRRIRGSDEPKIPKWK